jgi:hypothetical protein
MRSTMFATATDDELSELARESTARLARVDGYAELNKPGTAAEARWFELRDLARAFNAEVIRELANRYSRWIDEAAAGMVVAVEQFLEGDA